MHCSGDFSRQPLKHTAFLPCLQNCLKHSFKVCWKDKPLSTLRLQNYIFSTCSLHNPPFILPSELDRVFFTSDPKPKTSLHLLLYFSLIKFSLWVFINEKSVTYFSVCSLPKIFLKANVLLLKDRSVLFKNASKIRDGFFGLIISNIFYFSLTYSLN